MKAIIFLLLINLVVLSHLVRADSRLDLNVYINNTQSAVLPSINESTIHIPDVPESVSFNSTIQFKINVYRGKTLKRTVYTYIIDSNNKKVSSQNKFSLPTRFQSYNFTASLVTKSACSKASPFYLVVEGLDLENRTIIDMVCSSTESSASSEDTTPDSESDQEISKGKFSFEIIDFPDEIISDKPFKIRILIQNPTPDFMDIEAWSYIYKSSRSYSGDREQNKKIINIPEFANVTFDLENTVSAPLGDYKLKLRILMPNIKIPKELTKDIRVIANPDKKQDPTAIKINSSNTKKPKKIINSQKISDLSSSNSSNRSVNSSTVYLSSSAKARKLIPLGLIITLTLLLIGLIIRNF